MLRVSRIGIGQLVRLHLNMKHRPEVCIGAGGVTYAISTSACSFQTACSDFAAFMTATASAGMQSLLEATKSEAGDATASSLGSPASSLGSAADTSGDQNELLPSSAPLIPQSPDTADTSEPSGSPLLHVTLKPDATGKISWLCCT